MGNIITIYNPSINRSGSTTIAISLATLMARLAYKKVLLINYSNDRKMESYLSKVKGIKGIEYVDLFQDILDEEKLNMVTTSIDNNLDIIGGSSDVFVENLSLSQSVCRYIEIAKEKYDFIIIDLSNRKDLDVIKKAEVILSVLPFDAVFDQTTDLVQYENQINIINNIHPNLKKEIPNLKRETIAVSSDINVLYNAVKEQNIYHYLIDSIDKKESFILDIQEIMFTIMTKLNKDFKIEKEGMISRILNKFKKVS